jgi:hypothetical protein
MGAYSAFSWPKKAIPGTSWNVHLRVHWVFSNYVAWKNDFLRGMRPYTHISSSTHRASVRHFVVLKMILFKSHENLSKQLFFIIRLKIRLLSFRLILHSRATDLMSGTLRHFGHLKMWYFNVHDSLESKVSCFLCVSLRHFDGLEIRFLNFPENLGSRLCDHRWAILDFSCLENASPVEFRCSELKGISLPMETFIAFCRTENEITLGSWDHRPKDN